MSRYRVKFFKVLLSSDGHPFSSLQQSIVIRRAKSVDRAVEAAKRRFERLCHVPDWSLYADRLELEIDGEKTGYQPARRSHGGHR
jgi:hypothetical protein